MPKTTRELLDVLVLDEWDEVTLRGKQPRTLMQRTYGGQVLAQAMMACYASMPDGRAIHSLHAYFMRAGRNDRGIDYRVNNLRDGSSFSTRALTAFQDKPILEMSASFHVNEPGLDHCDPMPEQLPHPDDCRPFLDVMTERFGPSPIWHEWDALDVRFIGDSNDPVNDRLRRHPARMQVWVRTEGEMPDEQPLHAAVLAYLSDLTLSSVATLPHKVEFMSNKLQVASISHSMWFHRPARTDEWLLYDMESLSASSAIGYGFGRIFQDGKLVASCSQEGLIRIVDDRPLLT